MSPIDKFVVPLIVFAAVLFIAAEELPKLLGPAAILVGLAVIGRLVWFFTQQW